MLFGKRLHPDNGAIISLIRRVTDHDDQLMQLAEQVSLLKGQITRLLAQYAVSKAPQSKKGLNAYQSALEDLLGGKIIGIVERDQAGGEDGSKQV